MTDAIHECIICKKPAEKNMTWVNGEGGGVGSKIQGGPMCLPCMRVMDDALSRFQDARETLTIWPLGVKELSGALPQPQEVVL